MKIKVNPHTVEIVREQTEPINELEIKVSKCEFEFDEAITDDFVKEAYFTLNGNTYKQIIVNDECDYPSEVLAEKGTLEIGVVAFKVENDEEIIRYNPSPDYFESWVGSLKDAENSEPITPSDKEQIEQELMNISTQMDNLDVEASKVEHTTTITITRKDGTSYDVEVLDGEKGDKGDKGDPGDLDSTAIVDNLTTNRADKVLSAKQGKVLKDLVDANKIVSDHGIINLNSALDLKANTADVASEYATKESVNDNISSLDAKVNSLASGSPLVASSTSGMTDTTRIYVNTTDGHWYWYDGDSWEDGGVYQAAEDSDTVDNLVEKTDYIYNGLYNETLLPDQLDVAPTLDDGYSGECYGLYKLYKLDDIQYDLVKTRVFFKFKASEVGNEHSIKFKILANNFDTVLLERTLTITATSSEQYVDLDTLSLDLKSENGVWIGYESATDSKAFMKGRQYQNNQRNNIYVNNSAAKVKGGMSSYTDYADGSNKGGFFVKTNFYSNSNRIDKLEEYLNVNDKDNTFRILLVSDIHINLEDYRYQDHEDTQGRNVNIPDDERMKLLVDNINNENAKKPIDFVLIDGDLASRVNDTNKDAIYNKFQLYMKECNVPYITLIGNHDAFNNDEWVVEMGNESCFTIYSEDYAFICVNMYIDPTTGEFPSGVDPYVGIDANTDVSNWVYDEIDKAKANNRKIFMVWHDFRQNTDTVFKAYMDDEPAIIGDIRGHSHIAFQGMTNGKASIGTGNFGYLLYASDVSQASKLASRYSYKILEVREDALRCTTIFPECDYLTFMGGFHQDYEVSNDLVIESFDKKDRPDYTIENMRNMKYHQLSVAVSDLEARVKALEE